MSVVKEKYSTGHVRDYNKKSILKLILLNEGISRAELVKEMMLTPTSVGKIVAELLEEGLVREIGVVDDGQVGRKAVGLQVIPDSVLTIALYLDSDNISGGVVDITGNVMYRNNWVTYMGREYEEIAEQLAGIVDELYEKVSEDKKRAVLSVSIAVPGQLSHDKRSCRRVTRFHWKDFPIIDMMGKYMKTPLPIVLENDANSCALTECVFGTASRYESALMFSIGTGVKAVYMYKGRVLSGAHNLMGEIGHILVEPNDQICACGRYGCLETHFSCSDIEKRSHRTVKECVEVAKQGDRLCRDILDEATKYVSIWIANCINLYDPEAIVMNGELFQAWPEFYSIVTTDYKNYLSYYCVEEDEIVFEKSYEMQRGDILVSAASIFFYQYLTSAVIVAGE